MFIAYLPAGYILGSKIARSRKAARNKLLLIFTMIGSVAPDLDLIYFYTLDNRIHSHHEYFSHMPIFWLGIGLLGALLFKLPRVSISLLGLCLGGLLHCILDTAVGGIYWMIPFDDSIIRFSHVPKRYDFWVFNFIFHWYFVFEILICGWAFNLCRKNFKPQQLFC